MKRDKVLTLMGCILLALVLVLGSSAGIYGKPSPKPAGELIIGLPSIHTETFHPLWGPCLRKGYYEVMFDFLVGLDENMKLVPGIAYKWEESPDHMSWTYYIRDDVKFHDGTPVTLEDIKFSLDTILDKGNVTARTMHAPYQGEVEIVPPDKIVAHLKRPWPTMPYYNSPAAQGGGVILPKKYIEKVGKDFEKHPIGSGPYEFLEQKENDYIKFVAQDHHWRVGTPKYRYLTFKKLPEEGTRVASLQRGEVDVIMISRSRVKELEGQGFPIVRKRDATDVNLDFLYTYKPDNPISKKKVRQALAYAINKPDILEHILLGQGKLIGHASYMFSASIGHKDYPVTPYDPKKAKQLLAEAGYPDGFTIYLYAYATTVPEQKLICEAIAGYWEAIGMKVKILEMEWGAFSPVWTKKKAPPGPAAFVHSWTTRPYYNWRAQFTKPEKYLWSHVDDPVMDKFVDAFDNQFTLTGYIEYARKCEERVLEMFYKSGIANTDIPFATGKEVPPWNCGKGNIDSFRFEYIGATK